MANKTTDAKRMSEILERHRGELMALDADTLARPNVLRAHAVNLTGTLLSSFGLIEPTLDDELSPARAAQRRAQAKGLEERALAFFAADLAREEGAAGQESRRTTLLGRVAEHDRFLLKWAWPLFGDDAQLASVLADIRRGTGYQDDVEDVLRLVGLYRDHWAQIDGHTLVTLERLDRAEAEATEMVTLLDDESSDNNRDLTWRAFTAWRNDYRDLLRLGRYLMHGVKGVEALFPGIVSPRPKPGGRPSSGSGSDPAPSPDPSPGDSPAGPETGAPADARAADPPATEAHSPDGDPTAIAAKTP